MKLLVVMGGLTFFARCFDQARPYWSVIRGKQAGGAEQRPGGTQPDSRPSR